MDKIKKGIKNKTIFSVVFAKERMKACICDGEEMFNEPGLSHGFVHFYDPKTKKKVGFSGVNWFNQYAKEIR